MELRQIRSFLSIAENLHFGRAAAQLHLSQPALSLQIRNLEEELGTRLFERNRRGTSLTAPGITFRDNVSAALSQFEDAARKTRLAADGKLGLLRIGFISTAGAHILPQIMRHFRRSNPSVEFLLRNILTADQVRMLEAGLLDIGFLRMPVEKPPSLDVISVHREPFVLAVPSGHRFAKSKRVKLKETVNEDFLMYERSHAPGFHDLIFAMFRNAGVVPRICQTAGEMPTLISLIDAGMGIAVLPISAVKNTAQSVTGCAIIDKSPQSEIGIAFRHEHKPPAVDRFISFALNMLRTKSASRDEVS